MYDITNAILIILCCVFLYRKFCYKPKVKVVKASKIPKPEEIRRQRKKERRIRKIKRKFKIPYRGNAEIIKYDKNYHILKAHGTRCKNQKNDRIHNKLFL